MPERGATASSIRDRFQPQQRRNEGIRDGTNLLMRGTREYPMHNHPFTLVRIDVTDAKGKPVFSRPMWLTVIGENRDQLCLRDVFKAYRQRYDVEHFFRFGKQRLLTTAYQTSDVERSENWWQITQLAYVQLWLAKD